MRKLLVFNSVTLDGYFSGPNGDLSWAHKQDPEWNEFVGNNASGQAVLLLGRVTYDMMVRYWPTPAAMKGAPHVAQGINQQQKIVFSRSLDHPTWNNTTVVKGDVPGTVRKLKAESGPDLVILGSGSIVAQLTEARLIDEYQMALTPVVLGRGRTMFEGLKQRVDLRRTGSRTFTNGNVLLSYAPARDD
jgi:dihydrofolate reductase